MATLKEPFALDRSLNTTEETPRNIADVLAEELSRITGRNASQVEYDNTDSGLTADNVQDAIDEVNGKVPTLPTTDIQTAVDEFETYNGGLLSECKVTLELIQDLHGYAEPWVGGSKKNKLPLVLADIKANNTSGTWLGNKYTLSNVEFDVKTDSADNIIGIGINTLSATTGNVDFYILSTPLTISAGNYASLIADSIISGLTLQIRKDTFGGGEIMGSATNTSRTATLSQSENIVSRIRITSGASIANAMVYPMLAISNTAMTSADFAPYSNICPISGHTQVEVGDDGKNRFNPNSYESFDITGGGVIRYGHEFDSGEYTLINNGTGSSGYFYRIVAKDYSSYGTSVQITNNTSVNVNVDDAHFLRVFTASWDATVDNIAVIDGTNETFVPYNGYQVTVNLGGTYYSGTLDVVSGMFVPDTAKQTYPWGTYTRTDDLGNTRRRILATLSDALGTVSSDIGANISDSVEEQTGWTTDSPHFYIDSSNKTLVVFLPISTSDSTNIEVCYKLATPTSIQLSPTMVKALVGENHLSAPLEGQEITESKYRELFTWDEVEAYVNAHSGGGSGMNYSTEEQVVGTWIDGKPLYQKTFTATLNNIASGVPTNVVDVTSLNIDEIANISGRVNYYNGEEWFNVNLGTYFGAYVYANGYLQFLQTMTGQTTNRSYKIAITVQYTKTTD